MKKDIKTIFLATGAFLSFGTGAGDVFLPAGDDESYELSLGFSLTYFTQNFSTVQVDINGYLAFGAAALPGGSTPISTTSIGDLISAYNNDLMTSNCGNITTRSINDSLTLNSIGAEINSLLAPITTFTPKNAFVATWFQVCAYNQSIIGTVTFQILISTDGQRTFLTLNYGNLDYGAFDYGIFYQYLDSNSNFVGNSLPPSPRLSSNVNVNGKWIYSLTNSNKLLEIFEYYI